MEREHFKWYHRAILWSHRADKMMNLFLSYALALSSLIAYLDVMGNGEIIHRVPLLFFVWLSVQGLGVELQILIVLSRLPEMAQVQEAWKRVSLLSFHVLFIVLLACISIIIGAIFTQHGDTEGTIVQAERALGVSAIPFVYARASMATFLLILMGIDRMMEQWRLSSRQEQQFTPQRTERVEQPVQEYEQLIRGLVPILLQTLPPLLEQHSITERAEDEEHASRLEHQVQGAELAQELRGTDLAGGREPGWELAMQGAVPSNVGESCGELLQETSRKQESEATLRAIVEDPGQKLTLIQHQVMETVDEKLRRTFYAMQAENQKVTGDTLSRRAGIRKATTLQWLKAQEEIV